MDPEEIKQKSLALIKLLDEKVDKCSWRKNPLPHGDNSTIPTFTLKFESGSVVIGIETIYVYNKNSDCISEYKILPKDGPPSPIYILFRKVEEKVQGSIDAQIFLITEEVKKL